MQNNDAQYQKMIKTPIPRLILTLAGPTMVSMLSTAVYNAVDTYFVTLYVKVKNILVMISCEN